MRFVLPTPQLLLDLSQGEGNAQQKSELAEFHYIAFCPTTVR